MHRSAASPVVWFATTREGSSFICIAFSSLSLWRRSRYSLSPCLYVSEFITENLFLSCGVVLVSLANSGSIWRFCSQYPLEPLSYRGCEAVAPGFVRLSMWHVYNQHHLSPLLWSRSSARFVTHRTLGQHVSSCFGWDCYGWFCNGILGFSGSEVQQSVAVSEDLTCGLVLGDTTMSQCVYKCCFGFDLFPTEATVVL